jgi:hypothetical protein
LRVQSLGRRNGAALKARDRSRFVSMGRVRAASLPCSANGSGSCDRSSHAPVTRSGRSRLPWRWQTRSRWTSLNGYAESGRSPATIISGLIEPKCHRCRWCDIPPSTWMCGLFRRGRRLEVATGTNPTYRPVRDAEQPNPARRGDHHSDSIDVNTGLQLSLRQWSGLGQKTWDAAFFFGFSAFRCRSSSCLRSSGTRGASR